MIAATRFQNTDHSRISSAAFALWVLVATLAVVVFIAVIAAPVLSSQEHAGTATTIYQAYSYLCHQIPERSFHLAGHQFAVCSRCTGLYAGFAFAALGLPLVRSLKRSDTPHVIWLLLSAVPLTIDFGLTYFEIWQNNHFTRVTTGALFGAVAALYVVPGLIELSANLQRRFKSEPPAVAGG